MHGSLLHMEGTELNLDAMIEIVNAYMGENGITHEHQFYKYHKPYCASLKLPLLNTTTPPEASSLILNQQHTTYTDTEEISPNLIYFSYYDGYKKEAYKFHNAEQLKDALRRMLPVSHLGEQIAKILQRLSLIEHTLKLKTDLA